MPGRVRRALMRNSTAIGRHVFVSHLPLGPGLHRGAMLRIDAGVTFLGINRLLPNTSSHRRRTRHREFMCFEIVIAMPQQETRTKGMLISAVRRDEEHDTSQCRAVGQTSTKLRTDPHGL